VTDASVSLEILIARVAHGDKAAFSTLYQRVSAKLFGITLRICRERGLAEDALQDSFLRIWRNAQGFDAQVARAATWMSAIARNTAIDALRNRAVRDARLAEGGDEALASVPDGLAGSVDPMDRQALLRCLGGLTDEHRNCVLLAYHEGFSREELAERLGRPVGTIKTWLHRALAQLKTCLDA